MPPSLTSFAPRLAAGLFASVAALCGQTSPAPAKPEGASVPRPALDGTLTCVVPVRDLASAVAWYRDHLGMRLAWQNDAIGFAQVTTAVGDVWLGLSRQAEPQVQPGVVLTFGVLDIEQAQAALQSKKVTTAPIAVVPELVKLMEFKDPDGNTLQLAQSLQKPVKDGLQACAFLAGSWVRIDGDDREEEHWMAPSGGLMVGMERAVKAGKAVFYEGLRIEQTKDGIDYVASPAGRAETRFKLKADQSSARRVVFENLTHDFPQRVLYWLSDDGNLHARIEGDKNGKLPARDFEWQRGGLR